MPDRQLLAEARAMQAELAELRAIVSNLKERQRDALNEWASIVARLPLA